MEKNALWWVNAQTTEQFGVLEWQLNHLTNLLKLLANATNVFVGDAFGLANVFVVNGFILDDDVRVAGDLDDSLWCCLDNSERQCFCKQSHAWNKDTVACHDRSLGKTSASKAFNSWTKLDLLLVGHDWRKGELCAFLHFRFGNSNTVTKADTSIFTDDSVDTNDVHLCIFWATAPIDCCCGSFFTLDFDNVTRLEVESMIARDSGSTVTYI